MYISPQIQEVLEDKLRFTDEDFASLAQDVDLSASVLGYLQIIRSSQVIRSEKLLAVEKISAIRYKLQEASKQVGDVLESSRDAYYSFHPPSAPLRLF